MEVSLFGKVLTTLRQQRHISQHELAQRMGVHRNTVGKWERGICLPESKTMVLEVARQLHLGEHDTRQLFDASLTTLFPYWQMPYQRNPFFTGREEILQRLHEVLYPDEAIMQSCAVTGLGGLGKTQIAIEYAYRYANDHTAIFWINAETVETLRSSYDDMASLLNLPEQQKAEQSHVIAAVIRWLNHHSGWLLICDNVEDQAFVKEYLPTDGRGSLLVTSRKQVSGLTTHGLELKPLSPDDGRCLLLRRAQIINSVTSQAPLALPDEAAAREIVTLVGGLPLALDQAGAYLETTGCSVADYLHLLHSFPLVLLDERDAHADHPVSVTKTFSLAFDQLEHHCPAAAAILTVSAFMAPEAIPETLFSEGAAFLGPPFMALANDPQQWQYAITEVLASSLLQHHPDSHTLTIHRLVQEVIRARMRREDQGEWRKRMITALNTIFPEPSPDTWEQCGRLLSHVLACTAAITDEMADQDMIELLRKAACYLRERAEFEQAEPLYQRSLRIGELLFGSEHPIIAFPVNGLGLLYRAQGKYDQAEPMYLRALHIREHALGAEHPQMASPLNNLANLYFDQGKYEQAEPLYQRALRIREQTFGPEHPRVIYPLTGLAMICSINAHDEQAEVLYQRAIHIGEQAFGPEHPELFHSLINLADLYTEQGRFEQAEPLYRRAVQIGEQGFGLEHPELPYALNGLAGFYTKQKQYEQAELLYQQALQIWEHAVGSDHPGIADSLIGLAQLYTEQSEYERAELLFQRALMLRLRHLGANHPEYADILYAVGSLYQVQRRYPEACPLLQQAVAIREQVFGMEHPKTIAAQTMLYSTLIGWDGQ